MFRAVWLAVGVLVLLGAAGEPGAADEPASSAPDAASEAGFLQIASGLGSVTSIANAGDSRLFLTLRTGRVVIWDGRGVLPRDFLDISRRVSSAGGRGLFSIAFHPDYPANGFFFLGYADKSGNLVVVRYRRSMKNANRADRASGVVLLKIPVPASADHNGGELQFGPDGYLYVGVADGGSGEDPPCNAQRDDVLLGKILRLDVNANPARPPYYGIPPSNPFASAASPLDKVWARGLRHPRRFSFDRVTGDLYIGDVGQTAREEIDFQARGSRGGQNYGWRVMEGSLCAGATIAGCPAGLPPCKSEQLQLPIMEYGHERGDCSVVGGYVYRGTHVPGISGVYFYGDSCTGRIWGGTQPISAVAPGLSTFGEDSAGELYVGSETGALCKMVTPEEAVRYEATVRTDADRWPEVETPVSFPIFEPAVVSVSEVTAEPAPSPQPASFAPPADFEPAMIEAEPPPAEPPPAEPPQPPPPSSPERTQPIPVEREHPPPRTVNPR